MDRFEALKRLSGINESFIYNCACFDTGFEFRVLTHEGGVFVSIGGTWPVRGPYVFNELEYSAITKLLEIKPNWYPDDGIFTDDELQITKMDEQSKKLLTMIEKMDENYLIILLQAVKSGWPVNKTAYVILDFRDSLLDPSFYQTMNEAHEVFIEEFITDKEFQRWEQMDDSELFRWVEYLDISIGYPRFPEEEVSIY